MHPYHVQPSVHNQAYALKYRVVNLSLPHACCHPGLQVYSPLELLLFIAGCCTIADSFVPQLINVPKATVTHVVRAVLSMSFVLGAAVVVYNLKSRFCKEQAWQVGDAVGKFAQLAAGSARAIAVCCCGGVQSEVALLQRTSLAGEQC